MAAARDWDDIKKNFTSLTQEDLAEIDFQVKLIGEILAARKDEDSLCLLN